MPAAHCSSSRQQLHAAKRRWSLRSCAPEPPTTRTNTPSSTSDGLVHPYAKPLSLRDVDDHRQRTTTSSALGGTAGDQPLPVRAVVIDHLSPRHRMGTQTASTPGSAALALLAHAVPARDRPAETPARRHARGRGRHHPRGRPRRSRGPGPAPAGRARSPSRLAPSRPACGSALRGFLASAGITPSLGSSCAALP